MTVQDRELYSQILGIREPRRVDRVEQKLNEGEVHVHLAGAQPGVDEKSFTRAHRYFTLVNDLVRGRVLFVAENRSTESLDQFWKSLSQE